ncbi:MAG: GTPase [bacterium]
MPTNLPPEYFDAERKFREAKDVDEKVTHLEELLSHIPKHKGTDKLRAEYRKKLSKLKSESYAKKKTGKHECHFHIEREGAGRIIIIGTTNVGKSSLVTKLTHAHPEVSECPYTTWAPTPGMVLFENIHLQLIDTPPVDRDFMEPEFLDLIRSSDLVFIMLDIQAFPLQEIDLILKLFAQNKINLSNKKNSIEDERIVSIPALIVVNKLDDDISTEDYNVLHELLDPEWEILPISVKDDKNISEMIRRAVKLMRIIRIFSKPPGKDVAEGLPFILHEGCTIEEFAAKVHHDFVKNLKTARVWGKDVFNGQHVGRDHILFDGDVVELHI